MLARPLALTNLIAPWRMVVILLEWGPTAVADIVDAELLCTRLVVHQANRTRLVARVVAVVEVAIVIEVLIEEHVVAGRSASVDGAQRVAVGAATTTSALAIGIVWPVELANLNTLRFVLRTSSLVLISISSRRRGHRGAARRRGET